MLPPRFLQHIIVLCYLLIAGASLLFTVLRFPILLRIPLMTFSYGMMAPYQGFNRSNVDLRAEGQDERGVWQRIDLAPYYPVEVGEAIARRHLFAFRAQGDDAARAAYADLARQLLIHESVQGYHWRRVRLFWDSWPVSAYGYEAMRHAPLVTSVFLAEVP
ncbi:hypothetical protein HZA45_01825 [Candidatus Peregrinibacteria bacterium]|nr:hypothetical protein [Candidatus Peregrinibacteria bacterium]